MSKTTALRAIIKEKLGTVASCPIYYGQAVDETPSDFIIYSCDEVMREDGRQTFETEINVVGYGTNTAPTEDLCDAIQAALDCYCKIADGIAVYFYADGRHPVNEEDRRIIRRRMTFSTYLYER